MPVSPSDIAHLESATGDSEGGAITASAITSGVPNNVWPDISDAERVAGVVKYRKTFWKNNHATDDMVAPVMYVPVQPTNAALVIGLGLNSSDDADGTQGNMTAWSGDAEVALISDGTDTRVATIYGVDDAGDPATETVTLTSAVEVLSVNTYSKVWAVWLASTSGSRIVTVAQGSGGTTRGTIGLNKKACWLWVAAANKAAGIELPDLPASQNYGMWRRLTVTALAGSVRPNSLTVRMEEKV